MTKPGKEKGPKDPVERAKALDRAYSATKGDCAQVIKAVAHIERCLFSAHPLNAEAWKGGGAASPTDGDWRAQEMNAMI